jgi:hypothetical protein
MRLLLIEKITMGVDGFKRAEHFISADALCIEKVFVV